jgi:hypothetical protein
MRLLTISLLCYCVSTVLMAQTAADSSATADSLLAIQLASEMQQQPATPAPAPVLRTAPTTNPDISAIGDFRTSYSSDGQRNLNPDFHQLELQVTSVVDPYGRANFIFSLGKDSLGGEYGADLEEATLTSLTLPASLQITLGKFKPNFTKVNIIHPHAFPFVDFPVMIEHFFSDEGLFMEGASASILVPNPWDFYQEFDFEIGRSETNASLGYGATNKLLSIAHLNNFFDLSDNSTLGVGLSGLNGPNAFNLNTTMAGIDLTYKWKPVQFNTYNSFTWQTEGMLSSSDTSAGNAVKSYGAYTYMEYQIEKRIFLGARFDYSGLPGVEKADERTESLLFRMQPTEFSIFALEFQNVNRNYAPSYRQVVFRAIFGIGTHAAHSY